MPAYTCREPGCDKRVSSDRGRWCRCAEHRKPLEKAGRKTVPTPAEITAAIPDEPMPRSGAGRYELVALQLVDAAKELDKARAEAQEALVKVSEATTRYRRLIEEAAKTGGERE